MEKQITAIEWLFEQLPDHLRLTKNGFDILQQAKELEKQQIIDAYKTFLDTTLPNEVYEEYYNETFNNQN